MADEWVVHQLLPEKFPSVTRKVKILGPALSGRVSKSQSLRLRRLRVSFPAQPSHDLASWLVSHS
jgi:hypothetical protein